MIPLKIHDSMRRVNDDRDRGLFLADLPFEQGGYKELFENTSDIDTLTKQPGFTSSAEDIVSATCLLMENEKSHIVAKNRSLFEDVRSVNVGGFQDFLFPVIRSSFPVNPILDWVSVQPMSRRHGQIFYMNYVVAQTKGNYAAGSKFFDALTGYRGGSHYSDEFVDQESIGTTNGSATSPTCSNLAYAGNGGGGVRPGTLTIQCFAANGADTLTIRDNGNGVLYADNAFTNTDFRAGTVYYSTGAVSLTFNNAPATGTISASYEYDSEGSTNLPQIDVQIVTSPVTAKRNALRYRYSMESLQDFQAELGRNIDEDMIAGASAAITTEQARQVVSDLWAAAGAPFTSFNIGQAANSPISQREYFSGIQYPLNQTINQMLQETQRNQANVMIVDVAVLNVLSSIGAPYFFQWERANLNQDQIGVKFAGTWQGTVRVYVDTLLNQQPGASPAGNALLLYKGTDFNEVAYVWAPYRLLYRAPVTTLDDMVSRSAMASRVARKLVNPRLIKRFELTNVAA
jgi:hypothetical protein